MVCATSRSGSNFLTDGLHATRLAGRPKQFFLPKFQSGYGGPHGLDAESDFAGYVRGIIAATATSNGVFGFKVMGWYLEDFLRRLGEAFGCPRGELLGHVFPRLRFVRIVRRNKLRQAISKARALQSGLWKVQEGHVSVGQPCFDPALISRCLAETHADEQEWERFFAAHAIVPHTVHYEDLCENYTPNVLSTLRFLGVRIFKLPPLQPGTVRQSDALSLEWETQFLALQPGAAGPPDA